MSFADKIFRENVTDILTNGFSDEKQPLGRSCGPAQYAAQCADDQQDAENGGDPGDVESVEKGGIGELAVKGPGVMKCYYKNQEATNEVLKDGWLFTGDMAQMDKERFVSRVLEMDTDGIYFQPPAEVSDPAAFQKKIQEVLPDGIEVELDHRYEAMFSYKSKNYALLDRDGTVSITGAALKSRGLEPFQRKFRADVIERLLKNRASEIPPLYRKLSEAIESRTIPLAELAKSETLNDSPESYRRKLEAGTGRRNRCGAGEAGGRVHSSPAS